MAVITSLLWCPGGSALAGHWEYHADSHGPGCPAALCSCWQTLSCHLRRCCRCCAFSYNTAEIRGFKANHDKTYQINYGTNTGTVKIPDSKRGSICTDTRFTSLLQSKLNLLSFSRTSVQHKKFPLNLTFLPPDQEPLSTTCFIITHIRRANDFLTVPELLLFVHFPPTWPSPLLGVLCRAEFPRLFHLFHCYWGIVTKENKVFLFGSNDGCLTSCVLQLGSSMNG